MEYSAKQIAELLKILGNENRLLLLCGLIKGPQTVSQLAKEVPNISQSALSQHLALLKAHGILDSSKSGQSVTYFILDHRVEDMINTLKKYYCVNGDDQK